MALERDVDRARPAPAGTLKLHGEFQGVQERVATAAVVLGLAGTGLMLPSLLQWMSRKRGRGFPVGTNRRNG
jgi:hypothetical protein